MILDILDTAFDQCTGQWNKRSKFYKSCGYELRWHGAGTGGGTDGGAAAEDGGGGEAEGPRGVALFVEEDESGAAAPAAAEAPKPKKAAKKKRSDIEDIISHVTRGNALFVDEDE
jgi:hypothetical protein